MAMFSILPSARTKMMSSDGGVSGSWITVRPSGSGRLLVETDACRVGRKVEPMLPAREGFRSGSVEFSDGSPSSLGDQIILSDVVRFA